MKWIRYKGPSPSRDVPGVGEMKRGVAVKVENEEVAAALLASASFEEGEPGAAAPAIQPEAGEEGEG